MKSFAFFIIACLAMSCTSKSKKAEAEMSIFSVNEIKVTIGPAGTPKRLSGDLMKLKNQKNSISDIFKLLQRESHFKLDNPKKELHLLKNEQDELGYQHLTFGRMYKGTNIWGDELKFHINNKNELYLFDGDYQPSLPDTFSTSPKLTNRQAEEAALKTLSLDYAQKEETKLFIFPSDTGYKTTWRVIVGKTQLSPDQWECLVDSESGDILYKSNLIRSH